jgi:manganese oxidase
MRAIAVLICVLVCVVFICGCTAQIFSPATTPGATHISDGPTVYVGLKASSYNPENLYIKTGTTVTWVNEEATMTRRVVHMPTEATGKILFQSEALSPGESFSYTFNKPGRYVYADPQHGGGRSPFVEVTDYP